MSDENTTVTKPEDDAVIVHDDPVLAEEKAHDALVADVTRMLDGAKLDTSTPSRAKPDSEQSKESADTADKGDDGEKKKEPSGDEKSEDQGAAQSGEAQLSPELQARAEEAGISKELAERLHQAGDLDEAIAAFDRRMIDYVQAQTGEKTKDAPKERRELTDSTPPPPKDDRKNAPPLDQEAYDKDLWDEDAHENLTKRDAYHQRRIDALEARLNELIQERQRAFDRRFDGLIDELGHDNLFGKGHSVPEDKQVNRDTLYRAYSAVCLACNADPNECDPRLAQRALAAMFPKEVFKQAQRQTIDRLRDAEGKFLSAAKSRGGPPLKPRTQEEVDKQLVSDVSAYLKKQGVQMSGV